MKKRKSWISVWLILMLCLSLIGQGNVPQMVKAVGEGELAIAFPKDWDEDGNPIPYEADENIGDSDISPFTSTLDGLEAFGTYTLFLGTANGEKIPASDAEDIIFKDPEGNILKDHIHPSYCYIYTEGHAEESIPDEGFFDVKLAGGKGEYTLEYQGKKGTIQADSLPYLTVDTVQDGERIAHGMYEDLRYTSNEENEFYVCLNPPESCLSAEFSDLEVYQNGEEAAQNCKVEKVDEFTYKLVIDGNATADYDVRPQLKLEFESITYDQNSLEPWFSIKPSYKGVVVGMPGWDTDSRSVFNTDPDSYGKSFDMTIHSDYYMAFGWSDGSSVTPVEMKDVTIKKDGTVVDGSVYETDKMDIDAYDVTYQMTKGTFLLRFEQTGEYTIEYTRDDVTSSFVIHVNYDDISLFSSGDFNDDTYLGRAGDDFQAKPGKTYYIYIADTLLANDQLKKIVIYGDDTIPISQQIWNQGDEKQVFSFTIPKNTDLSGAGGMVTVDVVWNDSDSEEYVDDHHFYFYDASQEPEPTGTPAPGTTPSSDGGSAPGVTPAPDATAPAGTGTASADSVTSSATPSPQGGSSEEGDTFTVQGFTYQKLSDGKNVKLIAGKDAKKIVIPDTVTYNDRTYGVTEIGNGACKNLKKLKTVKIGKNITTIGSKAFFGSKKLKKVVIQTKKLTKVGKKAFGKNGKKLTIQCPKKKLKAYKKILKKSKLPKKTRLKA